MTTFIGKNITKSRNFNLTKNKYGVIQEDHIVFPTGPFHIFSIGHLGTESRLFNKCL